ncbi:MAG: hypothetical protein WC234_03610 [Endomicrobiaceae bacterium]
MIKKFFVYIICGAALLMPCRLRILYAEFVGWIVQGFYFIYYHIMKTILNGLENGKK